MNFSVHRFETVSSTNDVAARLAAEGASEGTVVVAGRQSAGRGRLGRSWVSSPGDGLYLSVILRPPVPLEHVWQIGFVASLATAEAIRRVSGIPARIKWPNDILVGGKKLAGILIESPSVTHADIGRAVIIGIGINVNTSSFPPELGDRGTSILLQKDPASRIEMSLVQDALLDMLDIRYGQYGVEGFPPILDSWKALDCTVGMVITALMSDGSVTGIAAGIDTDGNLIAQCDNGSLVSINAGEVLMR